MLVRLGEVARESKAKWTTDRVNVPVVGLEHLVPNEICFDSYSVESENTFTKKFIKGQVLFGRRRAYQRKAAVADFDGICSGDITVIEAIKGKILSTLLPFIIQNPTFFDFAMRGSAGSLSPRVKWEYLADYEFELPSIEEQKVLADKLWAAYRLKKGYKQLLFATDKMVKSQFIEMFGTPESNVNNWQLISIADVVDSINYGTSKPASESGKYNYLRMNNITYDGALDLSDVKRINIDAEDKSFVSKGDLLFNRTNTKDLVGKTCVYQLDTPMVVAGYIIRVRFKQGYTPEYVSGYLNSVYGKRILKKMAKGAVHQANINAQEFQSIKILDAPYKLQEQYIIMLEQADKSKFELKQCIEKIDKVIKNLLNG